MKAKYLSTLLVAIFILTSTSVFSGDINPAGTPESNSGYGFSIKDIWNRIKNGAVPNADPQFVEPPNFPGGTGNTLKEIMLIAPEKDDTNSANSSHVINGKTYWDLTEGSWGLQTGTLVFPAHSPKTGQTTSYAIGDDGDLEKGIIWPTPRFNDNGNGTITDNLTGLIWLKDANCFGQKNWAMALVDCNTLANGACGLTDSSTPGTWRLPSANELMSIVHYGYHSPAIPNTNGTGRCADNDPFTDIQSSLYSPYYWSSTTPPSFGDPSKSLSVGMRSGTVLNELKTNTLYVWPVRGGR